MVPRSRAGYVEQVPLGVVDILEIRIVGYRLDAFLEWDDLIVARGNDHRSELQSLGDMHRRQRNGARARGVRCGGSRGRLRRLR